MRALPQSWCAVQPRRGQRGQTLIILAFLSVFLLTLLGLVIDTVRLYILSAQAERAAEAGALAGALYMPTYFSETAPAPDGESAQKRACEALQQNGVTTCFAPPGQVGAQIAPVTGNPYELQVTVTLQAEVFFLAYVSPNLSSATVSRTALAEYLPPIELGSRSTYFGDQADTDKGKPLQSFWARINGPWEIQENGDAYTPLWQEGPTDPITYPDGGSYALNRWSPAVCCTNHQQWPLPITNPDKHPAGFTGAAGTLGYNYAIVVPPGSGDVKVQIFNPAFDPSSSNLTDDDIGSACDDPNFNSCAITDNPNEYLQMTYSLYSAPVPFERSYDTLLTTTPFSPHSLDLYASDLSAHGCASGQAYDPLLGTCIATPGYVDGWHTLYTITSPGTYRLVVEATGFYGEHGYGIKLTQDDGVSAPPAGVQLYGWNDMCVYFKTTGADSIFDLGEIPAAYAGKTLDFSLFDPGDSSGNVYMRILDPSGNPVQLPSWVRTVVGSSGTELDATGRYYNGLWLHMPISIPASYNPPAGQDWWQIEYLTPNGQPTDTITINISLSGSPIHLVSEIP
jgi:Flp pilus assembly protein TadG